MCDCQARHIEVELTWSSMDIEAKGAREGDRPLVQPLGSQEKGGRREQMKLTTVPVTEVLQLKTGLGLER